MRVLIVDSYALMRKGLVALLINEPEIDIVGEASTVAETTELLTRVKPEIVLSDMRLKDGRAIDIIKHCQKINMICKFITLTSSSSEVEFKNACQAGVDGYILKHVLPKELVYAMWLVCQGRKYYDPMVMDCVINHEDDHIQVLTPRELDVLAALGKGLNNNLIARDLYITEFTVKKHIGQILSKLNLRDRTLAALYAKANGLVEN